MKRFLLPLIAFSLLTLAACSQATNTTASSSPRATGSVAASPQASGSANASSATKYVDLQVVVPQPNMNAGVDGMGWTVDLIAKGNGPAMDKIKPAFQTSGTATGRNPAFPGLVVLLKSSSGTSGSTATNANANLAKLFQTIGLPNTLTSASISSVGTSASASPSARASATASTGASASPAGSAATRVTATDTETAEATWFVQSASFGTDVDVELTVFVVDGDAPDTVNSTSDLKIVSNQVTVRFHINGSGGMTPSGTARPSGSASPSAPTTPAGSTAPGSASPSPSASATP